MSVPANEQECAEKLAQALELVTDVAEYYRLGGMFGRWAVLAETRARIDAVGGRIRKDLAATPETNRQIKMVSVSQIAQTDA